MNGMYFIAFFHLHFFGSTDQKNKSSLAGGKTKFLDFFFIGGIRNKMLGKVKNFQGWVDFRFY